MGQKHGFDKPMGGYLTPKSGADATALRGHFVAASGEFVGTCMVERKLQANQRSEADR